MSDKTPEEIADELLAQAGIGKKSSPGRTDVVQLPPPGNPMKVARLFVDQHCLHDHVLTLHHWRGTWWQWQRSHWCELENSAVRALLYTFTEHAHYLDADGNKVPWAPNRKKIGDLFEALAAITILTDEIDQPTWLDDRSTGIIVAVANGLLEVKTRQLLPHSPLFFNHTAVPFDYDKNAPQPKRWLEFLNELWPASQIVKQPAIDVLGEWFGYVISGRTDLHKIFMMVGPTRGGKGVIARILTELVGKKNVAGPTLNSFGNEFGMETLIGRSLAIISDARAGGGKNSSASNATVERMLSISGEDTLTVPRKYKGAWNGKLPVRLHVISNELPRLGDASSAIVGRLVLLLTNRSWLGMEDYQLETDLRTELSGILNWSLEGLQRLTIDNKNHFTRFEAAEEAITVMRDLASPVGAFVRERCELSSDAEIEVDDLYAAYKNWCQVCEYPKSPKAHFGRDLRAACPSVRKTRPRDGSNRHFVYAGITLRTPEDAAEEEFPRSGDNTPVTVTTMTNGGNRATAGHSGHSDQPIVAPAEDGSGKAARERETGTYRKPKSDDLSYDGPVVGVPDLGPDQLDAHGVPLAQAQAQPTNGGEPGLSQRRIRELAEQYQDRAYANAQETGGDSRTAECDAWLCATLDEEVDLPEHVKIEFERVMKIVFAV